MRTLCWRELQVFAARLVTETSMNDAENAACLFAPHWTEPALLTRARGAAVEEEHGDADAVDGASSSTFEFFGPASMSSSVSLTSFTSPTESAVPP
jgi:hypothetical protein